MATFHHARSSAAIFPANVPWTVGSTRMCTFSGAKEKSASSSKSPCRRTLCIRGPNLRSGVAGGARFAYSLGDGFTPDALVALASGYALTQYNEELNEDLRLVKGQMAQGRH